MPKKKQAEQVARRIPPQNLEAEQCVLGSILLQPGVLSRARADVTADDFYIKAHKSIFAAMVSLSDRSEPQDLITVTNILKDSKKLDQVGGPAYLASLTDIVPVAANIGHYAKIIKEKSVLRRLIQTSTDIAERCYEEQGYITTLLDDALQNFKALRTKRATTPPAFAEMQISESEMSGASLSPPRIVQDYLFAGVATLAAPGGTGKTTLVLSELINIALSRPVHGLAVCKPGWSLFVTAEDRREQLIARLREIIAAMNLTDKERQKVMEWVLIWDVTGEPLRLVSMQDGNVILTSLADDIATTFEHDPPVVVVFDPIISFGASESFINDNEQAIITAARRIVKGLGCCVRLIAHTGKQNARSATLDQYSSRGGSALSDGSRMVAVLQTWQPTGTDRVPPAGCIDSHDASLTILARPKLSYARANLPLIWIRRTGWTFEHFTEIKLSKEDQEKSLYDQIERFLHSEVKNKIRHTKTTLADAIPNTTRAAARKAVSQLMARGRIIEEDLPTSEQKTKRKTFLTTSAGFGTIQKAHITKGGDIDVVNNAAALRENNGGIISRPFIPQVPNVAENPRQDSARLAGLDKEVHEL